MLRRFNFNPYSLLRKAAYGFIGVFAHSMINKYIEADWMKWVFYVGLLMLGISAPIAIELASRLIPEEI